MGADNTYGEETFNPETKVVVREMADKYQEFFNFFSQEHGLILLESQMQDIIHIVNKMQVPDRESELIEMLENVYHQLDPEYQSQVESLIQSVKQPK